MFAINTISFTLCYLFLDAPVKGTELKPRTFNFVPYLLQGLLFYVFTRFQYSILPCNAVRKNVAKKYSSQITLQRYLFTFSRTGAYSIFRPRPIFDYVVDRRCVLCECVAIKRCLLRKLAYLVDMLYRKRTVK